MQVAVPLQSIAPSATWTGTAGSGFVAPPADPVRTTAKPVLQPLFAPRQRFTDSITIGVMAAANDAGSLFNTLGLEKVICHYEGNSADITAPALYSFPDANGVMRSYYGWWIDLAHNGTNGRADVYFEAVPRDTTMQRRVIGPFTMHPAAQLYDFEVEVAASQPVIVGQRYSTLSAAWGYLKSVAADAARVTITEAGDYIPLPPSGDWNRGANAGWLVMTATAPVRIRNDLLGNGLPGSMRPKVEPICWRGDSITFDMFQSTELYFEPAWLYTNWLDGVNFTNSAGRNQLIRKQARNLLIGWVIRGRHIFTECAFSNLWTAAGIGHKLVRGCSFTGGYTDVLNDASCAVNCTITDHDSSWFRQFVPALSVQYTGGAGTATVRSSGTTTKTWTLAENGVDVASFILRGADADALANTNYAVKNLVDWINTRAGWSAALIDDTRLGVAAGLNSGVPGAGFVAQDAKAGALTFYTAFDIHADIYQHQNAAAKYENVVIWGIAGWQIEAQDIFLTGTPGMDDVLVANCAFNNVNTDGSLFSQMQQAHSHVMLVHNSWATQGVWFRPDIAYNPDSYCLAANNAALSMSWTGTPDTDLVNVDNHLQAGGTAMASATGTTIGGTATSLFINASAGDFRPQGELLTNLKPPVLEIDRNGAKRSALAAMGAVAQD